MNIAHVPSPNFNVRKAAVDMVILHYTGMESGEVALERMCNPDAEVSAHYMVWEDGRVTRLVEEDQRAWHAGVGSWQGDTDLNSHSVGIEIVNGGHTFPHSDGRLPPYPDAQIEAVIRLTQDIVDRHTIPQSRIVGHSDIAPDRKIDPGEHFPWQRLAEAGLGLWPIRPSGDELMGAGLQVGTSGAAVRRLQSALSTIGYGIETSGVFDRPTESVVRAFQRRWHPDLLTGSADWMTIALIASIADQASCKNADA